MAGNYVHGYAAEEQQRLVAQAEYWRETLLLCDIKYEAGERLLEIGCGAGAILGVLGTAFPGLRLAGIDLEARQVEFARAHLEVIGQKDVDLRVGDARRLPWPDASFDHVYAIWLLEHTSDAAPLLREAHRVLRPGGSVVLTETDYTSFRALPASEDYEYLRQAQYDLFEKNGNPVAGRQLGTMLVAAGFREVTNSPAGFHFFRQPDNIDLRAHVDYVAKFLEPAVARMVADLGRDEGRLHRGLKHLRALPDERDSSFSQIVYRAKARR